MTEQAFRAAALLLPRGARVSMMDDEAAFALLARMGGVRRTYAYADGRACDTCDLDVEERRLEATMWREASADEAATLQRRGSAATRVA